MIIGMCGMGVNAAHDISLRSVLSTNLETWRLWLQSVPYTIADVYSLFAKHMIAPKRRAVPSGSGSVGSRKSSVMSSAYSPGSSLVSRSRSPFTKK